MRAYLIAQDGAAPDFFATGDALVLDIEAMIRCQSLRAAGEAARGDGPDVADVALRRLASHSMTKGGGATRCLLRVGGIAAPDLDACLAASVVVAPDAIVLPVAHGRDVAHLGSLLAVHEAEHGLPDGGIGIVALVSCAADVLAAASFAGASPRLRGLGWDAEALARQLGLPEGPARPSETTSTPRPWGVSSVLAHARAVVRLTAAAAGVEAIEAAYPGDDAEGFGAYVAAARRDGFGAMFVRGLGQARLIRDGTSEA